jgi:hypothetical protein
MLLKRLVSGSDRILGGHHCSMMCAGSKRPSGATNLDKTKEVGDFTEVLKMLDQFREWNSSHYEKAIWMTLALGLEPGMRHSPFELIDERG